MWRMHPICTRDACTTKDLAVMETVPGATSGAGWVGRPRSGGWVDGTFKRLTFKRCDIGRAGGQ